jgi:hypothetical protein
MWKSAPIRRTPRNLIALTKVRTEEIHLIFRKPTENAPDSTGGSELLTGYLRRWPIILRKVRRPSSVRKEGSGCSKTLSGYIDHIKISRTGSVLVMLEVFWNLPSPAHGGM